MCISHAVLAPTVTKLTFRDIFESYQRFGGVRGFLKWLLPRLHATFPNLAELHVPKWHWSQLAGRHVPHFEEAQGGGVWVRFNTRRESNNDSDSATKTLLIYHHQYR